MAHSLLGERPVRIRMLLDREGSFSGTFGLMAKDSAMVAGAMGILPDDVRLFQAQALARRDGIDVADQVGRRLPPELLCTSRGGVCIAPSSLIRADEFRDSVKETQAQGVARPPGNLI
jgi:hypothetical protein